jgi:hypothetical protein
VEIAGNRIIRGGNGLADGKIDSQGRARIRAEATRRGFAHVEGEST